MGRVTARPRVAILGCGAVGSEFAAALADSRRFKGSLLLWSRTASRARRLHERLGLSPRAAGRRARVAADLEQALGAADVVLLCVADRALSGVVRDVARAWRGVRRARPDERPVVLIVDGGLSLAILGPLARAGLATGRLHPLVPVPSARLDRFRGAPFALEGSAEALRAARALVDGMQGTALVLRDGGAGTYHAAASLLGGGTVALLALAERALSASVSTPREVRGALHRFVRDVADGVLERGPARALTGAVARGSEDVVRAHLRALRGVRPAPEVYRVLGRVMLELARERGGSRARVAPGLARLVAEPRRRRPRS